MGIPPVHHISTFIIHPSYFSEEGVKYPNMKLELISQSDSVRKALNYKKGRSGRSAIGQFLTPAEVARYMASLFQRKPEHIRLLDPGAGAGVLSAACVETFLMNGKKPRSISIVAYENDKQILQSLQETMDRCETACITAGVVFSGEIRDRDFIESALGQTEGSLFIPREEPFTHAILNPPYQKLSTQTCTHRLLESAGMSVSNLYAAFVWLSARLLAEGGELAAITPRSFCNGPYFRPFRVQFLSMMNLLSMHVFESRKKAFSDDSVLQENVIYYARRESHKSNKVIISSSDGSDFEKAIIRSVPYERVVSPIDRDKFVHLAASESDEDVMEAAESFKATLFDLGIDVSTGRVVDFRARGYLRSMPENGTVPLIYPCHFKNGFVNWPCESCRKPNAIISSEDTKDLMVPAGCYVVTKRFTSKEEKRRVVAAIFDPHSIESRLVGFENHLNYFHEKGSGLPIQLAKGLALYLNSMHFDRYFRIFSGHTQVNATDLRKMGYPSRDQLVNLGRHVKHRMPEQEAIDPLLKEECGSHA
jgi:adenine-specific DNA-methyltransferase